MSLFNLLIVFFQIHFYSMSLIKLDGQMEQTVISAVTFILNAGMPEIPKIDKKEKPKVTVVIPVYNEEKYLKNVIRSIQYQSLKEIEILFIDDKSTDKSVKKILKYKKEDPRIRLIKNTKNRGILYNRIFGGIQSKGEYVTFIDADDLYANPQILQLAYEASIKNKLDICEFDYFGGRYDLEKKEFLDVFLFSNQDKSLYGKVYYQPDIKKSFFYDNRQDLIAGIVYNKLYSHNEILKMADYIGEEFWNQHFIYMEDFIMSFAVARTAESFMLLGYGGVYHWYENPEGMTKGVFDMDGNKLKYPDNSNKKLGDYLSMWERAFDLTEDEPDSEYFRLKLIYLLKDPDNRHVFARTYQYERILHLYKRMYNWNYATERGKNFAKEFGIETIGFEVPMRKKYYEFYGDEEDFELDEEVNVKKINKKNKDKNKKNTKINTENEVKYEKTKNVEEKVEEKKKTKKNKKKKVKDVEEIDGYIEGIDDL